MGPFPIWKMMVEVWLSWDASRRPAKDRHVSVPSPSFPSFFCKTTFKNCLTVLLLSTGMYHPPVLFWFWTLESTLLSIPEKWKHQLLGCVRKKAIIASGSTFEKSLKSREIEKVAVFFFKNNVGLANFYYRPKSSWNRQKKLESRKLSFKVLVLRPF